MPHSYGYRARTRHMFSRDFRTAGQVPVTTYLHTYRVGQHVDIKALGTIHKGMPFKFYHGKTGVVYNVTKRALGIEVNKVVGNRIMKKRINVRVEHVRPSKCRDEFLARCRNNDKRKAEARASGKLISTKRVPLGPRPGFTVKTKGNKAVFMHPQPYVLLM